MPSPTPACCFFFFFNDTATTEIYTLSLHDALPISFRRPERILSTAMIGVTISHIVASSAATFALLPVLGGDRKSTRLNSSHSQISYAVFCLKKKKKPDQRGLEFSSAVEQPADML